MEFGSSLQNVKNGISNGKTSRTAERSLSVVASTNSPSVWGRLRFEGNSSCPEWKGRFRSRWCWNGDFFRRNWAISVSLILQQLSPLNCSYCAYIARYFNYVRFCSLCICIFYGPTLKENAKLFFSTCPYFRRLCEFDWIVSTSIWYSLLLSSFFVQNTLKRSSFSLSFWKLS